MMDRGDVDKDDIKARCLAIMTGTWVKCTVLYGGQFSSAFILCLFCVCACIMSVLAALMTFFVCVCVCLLSFSVSPTSSFVCIWAQISLIRAALRPGRCAIFRRCSFVCKSSYAHARTHERCALAARRMAVLAGRNGGEMLAVLMHCHSVPVE